MPLLALRAIQSGARLPDQGPTAREVAGLPKFAEKSVNAIAQAGEIQTFKSLWRVNRNEFDQWLDEQPRGGDGGSRGE